ncbi:MAG: DUF1036 domain-containing protein [Cyanosarcina radialis HA8281-LM2]|jgi:uncharacterized membrane protein|nr:DUF1036 domain-containing protein [Cyanosarcina radialis HA8281-LM2]
MKQSNHLALAKYIEVKHIVVLASLVSFIGLANNAQAQGDPFINPPIIPGAPNLPIIPGVPEPGYSAPSSDPLRFISSSPKQFRLCNRSNARQVSVAYAYYNGQSWVKRGWYTILRGQCSTLTKIYSRYVYFYAEGSQGEKWSGNRPWCVHPTARFSLPMRPVNECITPYELRPFVGVDTGKARQWTHNLGL